MKTLSKALFVSIIALGLTACGKPESVSKLETLIAEADTALSNCEGKKGAEMVDCTTKITIQLGTDWSANVIEATNDDGEAVAALTDKMTAVIQKGTDMASSAF